jgi:hypothetical protein
MVFAFYGNYSVSAIFCLKFSDQKAVRRCAHRCFRELNLRTPARVKASICAYLRSR